MSTCIELLVIDSLTTTSNEKNMSSKFSRKSWRYVSSILEAQWKKLMAFIGAWGLWRNNVYNTEASEV